MSVAPKYILTERIAQGGMAEIHLGKIVGSDGFSRVCAFKRILPHFAQDKEFIQMFRQEAMLAKQLQNKNIVQVFDFVADDSSFMLVMEYVDGQDLRSVLATAESLRRRIPVEICCYILIEVLNGLSFAHSALDVTGRSMNIIHRDISPQNVLLSYEGDVKITDFGIAKAQNSNSNTQVGVLKGKFRYMSPEQASGREIDARSDIFAAGVILYEMITMTRLFKGEDMAVLEMVRRCNIAPPSAVRNTRVPPELEAIMMKLLARDPAQRYQSARAAVRDLSRFLYSFRPDFFPGEVAEFMQMIFRDRLASSRERLRSTLALPVDAIGRATRGMDVAAPESAMSTVLDVSQPPSRNRSTPAESNIPRAVGSDVAAGTEVQDGRHEAPMAAPAAAGQAGQGAPAGRFAMQQGQGQRPQATVQPSSPHGDARGRMQQQPGGRRFEGTLELGRASPEGGSPFQMPPQGGQLGGTVLGREGLASNRFDGKTMQRPLPQRHGTNAKFRAVKERPPGGAAAFAVVGIVVIAASFAVAVRRNDVPYTIDVKIDTDPPLPVSIALEGPEPRPNRIMAPPLVFSNLKGGDYRVTLSRPGFKKVEFPFSTTYFNRAVSKLVKLEPQEGVKFGKLRLSTVPSGATVSGFNGFALPLRSLVDDTITIEYLPIGPRIDFEVRHERCPVQKFAEKLDPLSAQTPKPITWNLRNCR